MTALILHLFSLNSKSTITHARLLLVPLLQNSIRSLKTKGRKWIKRIYHWSVCKVFFICFKHTYFVQHVKKKKKRSRISNITLVILYEKILNSPQNTIKYAIFNISTFSHTAIASYMIHQKDDFYHKYYYLHQCILRLGNRI